jgi:hypothetical protein
MWSMRMSGPEQSPEEQAEQQRRWRRRELPDNEVPVGVALNLVLAENADTAVALTACRVFSNGVELQLTAVGRTTGPDRPGLSLTGVPGGSPPPLFGVEYSDGRVARADRWGRDQGDGDSVRLALAGGSGGGRSTKSSFFLTPLPAPGRLRLIFAWSARDLPETITEVSADVLLNAAGDVRTLWPWAPEPPPSAWPKPPPPPPGGWFAAHHDPSDDATGDPPA